MKKFLLLAIFAGLFSAAVFAQTDNQKERLKVFVDCSNSWCDMDFMRTEINIIDFMLDRIAADVHVLITQQNTGGGGINYQLIFYGQNTFKNLKDTIRFNTDPNATQFERRDQLIKYFKMGLAPYVAKTTAGKDVTISFKRVETEKSKKDTATKTKDPWNYWVFNIGGDGNLNSDDNYRETRLSGNFSANRVTDKLKIGVNGYYSKNKTVYNLDDGNGNIEKFTTDNHNYNFDYFLISSLSGRWSYGYRASVSRNTFSNNKNRIMLETGFEFALIPYKFNNTKYFTLSYRADMRRNEYYERTLYDKKTELLYGHAVETNLSFNQKWGTIRLGAEYHNYFHNWDFYNLSGSAEFNIRITGGLSLSLYGFAELSRDQIFLPKGEASPQQVLARQRQLASGYYFYTYFGLNYRFGSKLNNFVNPRFN